MSSDIDKFSDQVFNADNVELSKSLLDDFIAGDGDSLLVDLSVSSLVDHLGEGVSSGISECDIRFDLLDHVKGGSVNSDQNGLVDLSESEQLEDLFGTGSHIVDTSDSDHKDDSGFSWNIEGSSSSGFSLLINEVLLFSNVFLVVSFTSLGIFSSLGLGLFLSLGKESLSGVSELGVSGSLLKEGLWDVGLSFFDLH